MCCGVAAVFRAVTVIIPIILINNTFCAQQTEVMRANMLTGSPHLRCGPRGTAPPPAPCCRPPARPARSAARSAPCPPRSPGPSCAVDEQPVILLHPPLPVAGVSTWMERGCQQNGQSCTCTPARKASTGLAVGESSVILLHPPLHLVGVSIGEGMSGDVRGYTGRSCRRSAARSSSRSRPRPGIL